MKFSILGGPSKHKINILIILKAGVTYARNRIRWLKEKKKENGRGGTGKGGTPPPCSEYYITNYGIVLGVGYASVARKFRIIRMTEKKPLGNMRTRWKKCLAILYLTWGTGTIDLSIPRIDLKKVVLNLFLYNIIDKKGSPL